MAIPCSQPQFASRRTLLAIFVLILISRYKSENFLPLGLCPGPSQPKDLDSFLIPFLDELKLLHHGVLAYDSYTQTSFNLKVHLVLITGDTPGVSKLFHLSGHVAKHPCRACKIEGTPFKITFEKKNKQMGNLTQYYFPLRRPVANIRNSRTHINVERLPHCTLDQYIKDGEAVRKGTANPVDSGVKGESPFVMMKTISFPASSPFDVMHLVFLGFVRDLCALLNGTFFKAAREHLNDHNRRMST